MKFKRVVLGVFAALSIGAGTLKIASVGGDLTQAGQAFVATLSHDQKTIAILPFEDARRVDWHYIPKPQRKGLQLKDMTDAQRDAAHRLLRAGLSQVGYEKATAIMALDDLLAQLEKSRKNGPVRSALRYFFTVFGTPGPTRAWGLSIEGHHLSLNFVVESGQLTSFTPCFFGANPHVIRDSYPDAPKQGTMVLQREEQLGFGILESLEAPQRQVAVIAQSAPRDVRGGGEAQPKVEAPAGLSADKMTPRQQAILSELLDVYLGNLPSDLAKAARAEIEAAGMAAVHFAWAGADKPGVGHYYRLHGPTFIAEYCNNQPDSAGNKANHSHAVWRDTRGDFSIHR